MAFAQTSPDASFARTVVADPGAVSRLREEFSRWLAEAFRLDEVKYSDIVLAVNEAMSNVAEFAYRDAYSETGDDTFRVQACPDAGGRLVVTVADHGAWRDCDPDQRCSSRGRGIPLMKALADRFSLEPSPDGTRVRLAFEGCPYAAPISAV